MPKIKYVGPSSAVDIDPDVGEYTFKRGEWVEVPAEIAARFVDRPDFETVKEARPVKREENK